MHKYSAESYVAESFDMCYAEVQPERYALACVLKRDSSRETWTVGRKQFNSTVLSGFFGGGSGQKFVCAQVEDGISFNTDDESNSKRK